jgi:hypothetical protein
MNSGKKFMVRSKYMNKLTTADYHAEGYPSKCRFFCVKWNMCEHFQKKDCESTNCRFMKMYNKLFEYEDLGFEPEELKKIIEGYQNYVK